MSFIHWKRAGRHSCRRLFLVESLTASVFCVAKDGVQRRCVESPVEPAIQRHKVGASHLGMQVIGDWAKPPLKQPHQGFGLALGFAFGSAFSSFSQETPVRERRDELRDRMTFLGVKIRSSGQ